MKGAMGLMLFSFSALSVTTAAIQAQEAGTVLATSEPLTGDLLRGEVTWRDGDIAALQGQQVSLRFTLQNASLYSFWLED